VFVILVTIRRELRSYCITVMMRLIQGLKVRRRGKIREALNPPITGRIWQNSIKNLKFKLQSRPNYKVRLDWTHLFLPKSTKSMNLGLISMFSFTSMMTTTDYTIWACNWCFSFLGFHCTNGIQKSPYPASLFCHGLYLIESCTLILQSMFLRRIM
jgi:hypothetical protein